jgi:chitin disaccharide deacetylase
MLKHNLIINADDLGFTRGINRAVVQCARAGTLSSATIMAAGDAFEHAVSLLKGIPSLGVGVHVVLTDLRAIAPPREIPGLTDGSGFLPPSPNALAAALLEGRIGGKAIRHEIDQQVAKVLDAGIVPTHLDSHKHLHALPPVMDALCEVALKYSIGWVRNPFESGSALQFLSRVGKGEKPTLLRQATKARLYTALRPAFVHKLRLWGLRAPEHFFGVSLTGLWTETAAERILTRLPLGLSEIMVHPGTWDQELCSKKTRLLHQRQREADILLSPVFKDLLSRPDIRLGPYGKELS